MRRIVSALFLVIIVLVGLPLITLAQGKDSAPSAGVVPPLTVEINGLKVNAPAEMDVAEGQVMVPLRWAAEQLGASSIEWDSETRTVTIRTGQDFYNLEKLNSYVRSLQDSSNEQNDQLWPLPARVRNLPLSHAVPNLEQVLELDKYRGHSKQSTLPHDPIYIRIISEDSSYEHGSFVYSAENRQNHYYLPMDWLEYLFHASADYNEVANVLSIQPPDVNQVKSQIAWAENALVPVSAEEALKLWGRGLQTRIGALQYAALSPQLRQKADNSYNVRQTYWVTGFSSPWAGPITITSQDKVSDTRIEYTISFPEITSAAPNTTATEKLVIEKIPYESGEGWFITQILQASGYGIIGADIDANMSKELEHVKNNFYETISYDPGQDLLSFTIPQTIPSGYKFYLHISGRMFMGDNTNGMSFHAFDKESQDFTWKKGRTYTYSLPSATLDECIIDFGLIDCNNQEFLTTVQISAYGNKTLSLCAKVF